MPASIPQHSQRLTSVHYDLMHPVPFVTSRLQTYCERCVDPALGNRPSPRQHNHIIAFQTLDYLLGIAVEASGLLEMLAPSSLEQETSGGSHSAECDWSSSRHRTCASRRRSRRRGSSFCRSGAALRSCRCRWHGDGATCLLVCCWAVILDSPRDRLT